MAPFLCAYPSPEGNCGSAGEAIIRMARIVLSEQRIYGILTLLWMVVVFSFSSIHGSGTFFEPPFWYILERKGAHVIEFSILAFLVASFLSTYSFFQRGTKLFFCVVFLFCLTYAFSDEIHQFFVFGREARLTDVVIDSGGILIGEAVFFFRQRNVSKKILRKTKTSR